MALEKSSAIFVVGHHQALPGGTSISSLQQADESCRARVEVVYLASKLNYHRLKRVVLQEVARSGRSFEIKEPPAEAGGVAGDGAAAV